MLTIVNRLGIHARTAAKLVTLCSRFVSEVNGPDEVKAIAAVTRLINTGFGEN